MIAIFNDGDVFLGYCEVVPPHIKKIKDLGNEFDPMTSFWDGDFLSGCVRPLKAKKLNAFHIEEEFVDKMKALYSNEISHILCIKQIHKISEKLECFDDNFKNMCDDIMPLIDYYDNLVKSLKEENNIETKEEIYEKHKAVFK